MSPCSRREYLEAIFLRYKRAPGGNKSAILDEFCAAFITDLQNHSVQITLDNEGDFVTCTFTNAPTALIPTINEWGMIIFLVFAGLGSVYYLRRQRRTES